MKAKDETKKLLQEREDIYKQISLLEKKEWEITNRLCVINGTCPYCNNWHYPHCGSD